MSKPSSVKTVDKMVQVLDAFCPDHPTWSLAELSAHLELPKSTLHRFLCGLESHGILRRDPVDMRWRLGYRLFLWGNLAEKSTGLRDIASPPMRDLVAATQETVLLTVYHAQEVVCIEKAETSHPVRLTLEVGTRRPPHAGASSKVLMAYLPDDEVRAIIADKGLPELCTNTITDPVQLQAELARIRTKRYAESHEETDPGAWGIATPIFDRNGAVIAAIGIAGPSSRYTSHRALEYVKLCRDAAGRVSALLNSGRSARAD
jgi:IclR family KDG regulon transcriptional repressor